MIIHEDNQENWVVAGEEGHTYSIMVENSL